MTAPDTDTLAGLLPCPFCGGEAWLNDYEAKHGDMTPASRCPQCKSCGCNLGYLPTASKAIVAWNRRAQAAKDKARIERLEAALKGARALLRSGADLLSVESEALREGITVNGELRPDPEDAPAVEAIEDIEAWIADVADFVNALAALEDGE